MGRSRDIDPGGAAERRRAPQSPRRGALQLLFCEDDGVTYALDGVLFELSPRRSTDPPGVGTAFHLRLQRPDDDFLALVVGSTLRRWAGRGAMVDLELRGRPEVTWATMEADDVRIRLDVEQLLTSS